MTEVEVVRLLREYFESLFPKTCSTCGRQFATLREYILTTKRLGPARSFDADLGDWGTSAPIGSLAMADCPCGSTLALTTERMALPQRLALLAWVKTASEQLGLTSPALLERLRDQVRKQVMDAEPTP
jgi:hypothetical protein